ncbi:MAG: hypothetical protein CMJ70_27505 [Planctomycetaceae bacterium]|nr:hypothetical protein [Planctomycetaceae bacterium]HAA67737.1 DUF1501 domain-containing protein [Planctomycetaceae bacterium]|tara:strand:- start:5220 stop:6608 length:1389 start_codon:yes stop_codon:yes gene_type:complete
MLTILGKTGRRNGFCDRVSRRDFLTIGGGLTMGSLTLPQLLSAESKAGIKNSHKAIINIFLGGGPPHQDMWDVKVDAPREIRGEFKPIHTSVEGIEICELFPMIAQSMEKYVPIRSIVGARGGHAAVQAMIGRAPSNPPAGGWPSMGAWVSRLQGPVNHTIPPHLSLMYKTDHAPWGDPGNGGFLGMKHAPFRLVGGKGAKRSVQSRENMVLKNITLDRLSDRNAVLTSLDNFRRETDATGVMEGVDSFTQQALGILTDSKLAEALDYTKEDPKLIERYGKGNPGFTADGAPKVTENFLVARRLVEAGARVVSMNFSRWDWHGGNFNRSRQDMPMLDRALTALVDDLDDRGMLDDVGIVCWGEFGRTPKINKNAGRDHWPRVSCAIMAGGGIRAGQVIGATNRLGEYATDRPVTFSEVHSTLYHNIGLDWDFLGVSANRQFDLRGRPYYPVDPEVMPMKELV